MNIAEQHILDFCFLLEAAPIAYGMPHELKRLYGLTFDQFLKKKEHLLFVYSPIYNRIYPDNYNLNETLLKDGEVCKTQDILESE